METTQTPNDISNLAANTGSYPGRDDIHLNAQMLPPPCPNKYKHVSSAPGYGWTLCPYCRKLYIHIS